MLDVTTDAEIEERSPDRAAKRLAIESALRERPQYSDRAIARDLGCDGKTVGAVRTKLEAAGELPQRGAGAESAEKPATAEIAIDQESSSKRQPNGRLLKSSTGSTIPTWCCQSSKRRPFSSMTMAT